MDQQKPPKSGKKWVKVLIPLLLVAAVLIGAVWVYFPRFDPTPYKKDPNPATAEPVETGLGSQPETEPDPVTMPELPDNPINFEALKAENPDVCGWITVPNTNVDYPILQSSHDDDNFYLTHGIDGKWNANGSLYIQRLNNNQFLDRNTVIYGHDMLNGTMFRTLHYFRDADFFNANDTITIYLPHHILTYRIFSAYRYDNRHILNSFDFSDINVYRSYLEFATNPNSMIRNVREGVSVTTDDRIVTLSTCIGNDAYRYLVQGVLIDDQYTK